jgi:AmmeMemoRadiSam system protein B/AmmeMemoRadiSam system protein A
MALVLMAGMGGCSKEEPVSYGPVVAGRFYTDDARALSAQINEYLEDAEPSKPGSDVLGYIVPHAGYIYSGPVAAYAYDLIQEEKVGLAVVMAGSHYVRSEKVGVLDVDKYRTPLGDVPVARDRIAKLVEQDPGLFTKDVALFRQEHSMEVQLPFLQETATGVKIVPIVMGNPWRPTAARLARALDRAFGTDGVVYLASTDMSHHFPYDQAIEMDKAALEKISGMDMAGLIDDIARDRSQLCGLGPVLTLMELAATHGYNNALTLKYANSGDTAGPKDSVVGYCSIAFAASGKLGGVEKDELVSLARGTIEKWLKEGVTGKYEPANDAVREWGAAFVTLKSRGRLRGCIGHVAARMPLYKSVQEMALAAAFQDPRFPPLEASELPGITLEISVMSPLRTICDPSDIEVGRDGLVIRKAGRSGLLLPQVAVEQGWDRDEFLRQTCVKAGLPVDAWKSDAEILAFSADVFGEEH